LHSKIRAVPIRYRQVKPQCENRHALWADRARRSFRLRPRLVCRPDSVLSSPAADNKKCLGSRWWNRPWPFAKAYIDHSLARWKRLPCRLVTIAPEDSKAAANRAPATRQVVPRLNLVQKVSPGQAVRLPGRWNRCLRHYRTDKRRRYTIL